MKDTLLDVTKEDEFRKAFEKVEIDITWDDEKVREFYLLLKEHFVELGDTNLSREDYLFYLKESNERGAKK